MPPKHKAAVAVAAVVAEAVRCEVDGDLVCLICHCLAVNAVQVSATTTNTWPK